MNRPIGQMHVNVKDARIGRSIGTGQQIMVGRSLMIVSMSGISSYFEWIWQKMGQWQFGLEEASQSTSKSMRSDRFRFGDRSGRGGTPDDGWSVHVGQDGQWIGRAVKRCPMTGRFRCKTRQQWVVVRIQMWMQIRMKWWTNVTRVDHAGNIMQSQTRLRRLQRHFDASNEVTDEVSWIDLNTKSKV